MEKRHHINQNIKELVPQALLVSSGVFPQAAQANKLVLDSLSILSLESQGRFLAHPVPKKLNYQVLGTMARLLKHKKAHINDKNYGFYNLQPFERFLLILKHRLGVSMEEIAEITQLPPSVLADKLYQAKVNLEKHSELSLSTSVESRRNEESL